MNAHNLADLVHAGGSGAEFSDDAIAAIHEGSGGVPRLVNKLSDFSMAYAMSADRRTVELDTVQGVLADDMFIVTREPPAAKGPTPLRLDRTFME